MKYPIGIQTFEKLREDGYVYVDKTALIYQLANEGQCYFLSRPRRFGKSLLQSTLKAYFEGRSELFAGLAIEKLETKWERYPVITLSFNTIEGDRPEGVDERIGAELAKNERRWGITPGGESYSLRFENLIHAAYNATGKRAVVLIDEYDKPLLTCIENGLDHAPIRSKLKAFYSVLKGEDEYLRFSMLTGVTRFSKVSVFSGLNNLNDISMDRRYATLCGITESELHTCFDEPVASLASDLAISKDECYDKLRQLYDGYHFAYGTERMYNPFSLLTALQKGNFESYWFASGSPSFIISVMKRTEFDLMAGLNEPVSAALLADIDTLDRTPLPILFQTGYLTIKDYDPYFREYTLDFPNDEVKEGFIECLLPYYTASGNDSGRTATAIIRAANSGDTDTLIASLKTLFDTHGNCMLYQKKSLERDFRNIVYMLFCILGLKTEAELSTAAGRMDICCQTDKHIYIIELKIDQTPELAVSQIKTRGYGRKFASDPRDKTAIGINFSSTTHTIAGSLAERL